MTRSPAAARAPLLEDDMQAGVIALARMLGYRVAHFRPALTAKGWRTPVSGDGKGFPDLILVRRGRVIVAELKSAKGECTPEQEAWLDSFRASCAEVYVWRPADYPNVIKALLQGASA